MNNTSENLDLFSKISNYIRDANLINENDRTLVAVSGGPDSSCLVHILHRLRASMNFELFAAHLNHKIRNLESDNDEEYTKGLCCKLGVQCFCESVDVSAYACENKISVEQAGRRLRYDYFERLSAIYKLDKIVTAHNKNDQAETVLMRILRGTGLDGLSGVRLSRGRLIRPLLGIERGEIEAYCKEHNLNPVVDRSNYDVSYTRNKIRHELLPVLQSEFNPSIVDTLARLADNVTEDAEFLNLYAQRVYTKLKMSTNLGISLHIQSFFMLQRSLQIRVIRLAAKDAIDRNCELERKHFKDIIKLALNHKNGTKVELINFLDVSIAKGWMLFHRRGSDNEFADKGCISQRRGD